MSRRAHKAKLIFISYRRQDAGSVTRHIYDRLNRRFRGNVFMDVFSSRAPDVIRERLGFHLGGCSVALVVIGRRWLNAVVPRAARQGGDGCLRSPRMRRIDQEKDLLRWEVQTALERKIIVITLLVEGATFPPEEKLPPELLGLTGHDRVMIREGSDFERDVEELIKIIEQNLYGRLRRMFRDFYFRHEHKMTVLGSITVGLIFVLTILAAMLMVVALTRNLKQTVQLFVR